jgi:hypothetical protein
LCLGIVLLPVDASAEFVCILMQIFPLFVRDNAVGFGCPLLLLQRVLLLFQSNRFALIQAAIRHAF